MKPSEAAWALFVFINYILLVPYSEHFGSHSVTVFKMYLSSVLYNPVCLKPLFLSLAEGRNVTFNLHRWTLRPFVWYVFFPTGVFVMLLVQEDSQNMF